MSKTQTSNIKTEFGMVFKTQWTPMLRHHKWKMKTAKITSNLNHKPHYMNVVHICGACMNAQHSSWPKYFENRLERRASLQAVVGCFEQMGLQSGIKCSGWLNVPNFTRQVIPERRVEFIGEWCPNVFVSKYGMHRILETYDTLPPKKLYFLFTALFAVRSNFIPLQFCATHTVVRHIQNLLDRRTCASTLIL